MAWNPSVVSWKWMRVRLVKPVVIESGAGGVCLTRVGQEADVPRSPFWRDLVDRGIVQVVLEVEIPGVREKGA